MPVGVLMHQASPAMRGLQRRVDQRQADSSEVNGNVTAQLRGLASKLADLGVSGTGRISSEQYQNVLRSDLAATLKDNAACKLKVFETLQTKFLRSESSPPLNITGRWRDVSDPSSVAR